MNTIYIFHENGDTICQYESNIIPQVGDKYPSVEMPDDQARIVTERLLNAKFNTNSIEEPKEILQTNNY